MIWLVLAAGLAVIYGVAWAVFKASGRHDDEVGEGLGD
jgi:hypothetical protein